jgi:hypothetical protein
MSPIRLGTQSVSPALSRVGESHHVRIRPGADRAERLPLSLVVLPTNAQFFPMAL